MKRITAAKKKSTLKKKEIINSFCPNDEGVGPDQDYETSITGLDDDGDITVIGCRGISCKKCWNTKEGENIEV